MIYYFLSLDSVNGLLDGFVSLISLWLPGSMSDSNRQLKARPDHGPLADWVGRLIYVEFAKWLIMVG